MLRLREKLQLCPIEGEEMGWRIKTELSFLDMRHRLCQHGFYSAWSDPSRTNPFITYVYTPAHIQRGRTWSVDLQRTMLDFKHCTFCKKSLADRDGPSLTLACHDCGVFKLDSVGNMGEVTFLIKPYAHIWPDLLQ